MLTPVEFLLARVTDLEQLACEATPGPWDVGEFDGKRIADSEHIATWDPGFVLAWCAAVRQVSDLHASCIFCVKQQGGTMLLEDIDELWGGEPCRTLLALLQPFADHPDFDPAWRQEEA